MQPSILELSWAQQIIVSGPCSVVVLLSVLASSELHDQDHQSVSAQERARTERCRDINVLEAHLSGTALCPPLLTSSLLGALDMLLLASVQQLGEWPHLHRPHPASAHLLHSLLHLPARVVAMNKLRTLGCT